MVTDQLIVLSRQTTFTKINKFHSWKNDWKKKSKTERVVLWVMLVIFFIYALSLLFPIFWAFINSFKERDEYVTNSFGFPQKWYTGNYKKVFFEMTKNGDVNSNIFKALWNSIWMSTLSTVLGLFASSLTSYVVSKYHFKGSSFIYAAVIFVQIIPLVGSTAGMYKLIHGTLNIANKPLAIWPIWFGGFGFSFLMLYSAFKSIPWSYAESAFIDGAGHFMTFRKIMLPSIKPVLGSLFIVNFIGAWNDYTTAFLYMDEYPPLALSVYMLQPTKSHYAMPVYLAVILISIIPTLILFISFQKIIMENTTTGGLKG